MRVMGVDLGIAKAAWSVWEDDILTETSAGAVDFLHQREDQLWQLTDFMASQIAGIKPDLIVIEDVLIGNNRKYSLRLAEAKGAVLSGVGMVRYKLDREHIQTLMVNVSTWKKEVLGNGHAAKEDVRNYLLQRDSAYAELCDGDQDRFDAACIGYYGVQLSNRADELMARP